MEGQKLFCDLATFFFPPAILTSCLPAADSQKKGNTSRYQHRHKFIFGCLCARMILLMKMPEILLPSEYINQHRGSFFFFFAEWRMWAHVWWEKFLTQSFTFFLSIETKVRKIVFFNLIKYVKKKILSELCIAINCIFKIYFSI